MIHQRKADIYADSQAMRQLVAAHGRLPPTKPPQWADTPTDTILAHREAERLKKARYRARKRTAA